MNSRIAIAVLCTIVNITGVVSGDELDDFCKAEPARVNAVLNELDLARPGLEKVRQAAEANDLRAAVGALLDYYRNGKSPEWLRKPVTKGPAKSVDVAEHLLEDEVTIKNKPGKIRRKADGKIDWHNNDGPDHERQWGLIFLRHLYLRPVLFAYLETGNRAYAEKLDAVIADFAMSVPTPSELGKAPPWGTGLEAASRARVWPEIFFALQDCDALRPATRLLILGVMAEHMRYLQLFHVNASNMAILQVWGLAEAAVAFPEFKSSRGWLNYAGKVCEREARSQVYPDGAQKELSDMYHELTAEGFEGVCTAIARGGGEQPASLVAALERMWTYTAYTLSPEGKNPGNNDSDFVDLSKRVLVAAKRYNREDWRWVATRGAEGKPPADGDGEIAVHKASVIFPWAGQVVMRSGFAAEAHWSFFDAGPWGANQATGGGHQHHDALHLSVSALGRPLLVDSGRFTYMTDLWWHYFTHGAAHNTILLDGRGQNPRNPVATTPLDKGAYRLTDAFDFAVAKFDSGFGDVSGRQMPKGVRKPTNISGTHIRAVMYVRDRCWLVVDRIETDRPRNAQALWHFHPDCTVVTDGSDALSNDAGKGNLRIVPARDAGMNVEIVKGQEKPQVQGWFGYEYGEKAPAPVAIFSRKFDRAATFAWLMVPARDTPPKATLTILNYDESVVRLRAEIAGAEPIMATLPLGPGKADPALGR